MGLILVKSLGIFFIVLIILFLGLVCLRNGFICRIIRIRLIFDMKLDIIL